MSGDWQVGDLALCIHGEYVERSRPDAPRDENAFLRLGGIYLVEGVLWCRGKLGLVIDHHHSTHPTGAYLASAFRRIPPHQADEFDRETIALLNRQPETLDNPRASLADRHGGGVGLCGFVHIEPISREGSQNHG